MELDPAHRRNLFLTFSCCGLRFSGTLAVSGKHSFPLFSEKSDPSSVVARPIGNQNRSRLETQTYSPTVLQIHIGTRQTKHWYIRARNCLYGFTTDKTACAKHHDPLRGI